jgi:16S rRNA (guanine(527)-N(7))-methyltransferase RsmG
MRVYVELLQRWNRRVNLTSIDRVEDQLRFSFFEAFWAADRFLEGNERLADVGAGAGFPGLAMKLFRPSLEVVLIEPNAKKVVFLKEVSRALGLQVEVFAGKGEDYLGWATAGVAAFRALRPSAALLAILARERVRLLLFEGAEGLQSTDIAVRRRELVPGSRQRYVTLAKLRPPDG